MKNLLCGFFAFSALAQAQQNSDLYISVDQTSHSVNQLVQDVLVNNQCATVTDIISSTGINFGSSNGIGYFSGDVESLPFSEGIVLTTGNALQSVGPETGDISSGHSNWPGDADLANAVPGHNLSSSFNATYIQFDFVPLSNIISFNFIFASDEYGFYQCEYTDAFAFLLTDNITGVTSNLAIVPNTLDPISVLSVRDDIHNGNCPSSNEDFFAAYYGSTGLPESQSPTNYRGHTVSMTAQSPVVVNRTYTIKLVIADALDPLLDAAVFLEAGSFNFGQGFLVDINACLNDSVQFDAPFYQDASYSWYGPAGFTSDIQNPIIENVNLSNQGEYFLEISINNDCAFTSSMILTTYSKPQTVLIAPLVVCDDNTDGIGLFTLTDTDDEALGGQTDVTVSYHTTEQDANDNAAALGPTYTNSNPYTEQLWIRLTNDIAQCYSVIPLDLIVEALPFAEPVVIDPLCDDNNDGLQTFDMSSVSSQIIGSQINVVVSYHYTELDAMNYTGNLGTSVTTTESDTQIIWVRLENTLTGCFILTTIDLVVDPSPTINELTPYIVCDDTNSGDLQETFDLSTIDSAVIGTETGVIVSYHATSQDALDNISPLPELYPSITQTIYAALESTITGCRVVSNLDLIVNPVPNDFSFLEINICNYNNLGDLLVDYPNIVVLESADSSIPLNPSATLLPGVYYVYQINDFSCNSPDLVNVYMSCLPIIPDGFSPNNDGYNDHFNIMNLYGFYEEHKLKIFNRYGTLIYKGNNSKKWYGHSDSTGELVPVGTYFYSLELNNSSNDIFTGWVYVNY
jgi:gliding motility-associated-like protein